MREFVIRTCLLIDFLLAIPVFAALIFVDPERYARTLRESEASIHERILKYRNEP